MIIRITITDRDIRLGCEGGCRACPVARAINRTFGFRQLGIRTVAVLGASVDFPVPGGVTNIPLPGHVVTWIGDFDFNFGQFSKPFAFDWDVPDDVASLALAA